MRCTWHLSGLWRLWGGPPGAGERAGVFAVNYKDDDWLPATVPGDVHSTLVAVGRIPEPYYHTNVDAVRWVEERNGGTVRPSMFPRRQKSFTEIS